LRRRLSGEGGKLAVSNETVLRRSAFFRFLPAYSAFYRGIPPATASWREIFLGEMSARRWD